MPNAALLLAAGKGSRMQNQVDDKVLALLQGKPLISYSVEAFIQSRTVQELIFVYRDEAQKQELHKIASKHSGANIKIKWALGGKERQDSVFNGLLEASPSNDLVFIHDCARPLIQVKTLQALEKMASRDSAACLARPVTDTIKFVTSDHTDMQQCELKDLERKHLWAMETPQVFALDKIIDAYQKLRENNKSVTDDTAAYTEMGHRVSLYNPHHPNPKLTTPADLPYLESLLSTTQEAHKTP